MSLFESLNGTLATVIADAIGKYHKGFFTKRVLKTVEEVEANTNVKNLPSAVVVGELINDLGGYSFGETSDGKPGYRKPGADTVTPFSSLQKDGGTFSVSVLGHQVKNVTVNFQKPFKNVPDFGGYVLTGSQTGLAVGKIVSISKTSCTFGVVNRDVDTTLTETVKWIAVGEV